MQISFKSDIFLLKYKEKNVIVLNVAWITTFNNFTTCWQIELFLQRYNEPFLLFHVEAQLLKPALEAGWHHLQKNKKKQNTSDPANPEHL